MKLREYQREAVNHVYTSMRQVRGTMLQSPTGSGKTVVAQSIIEHGLKNDRRIGFITDRIVLSDQTLDKFYEAGIPFGVVQADHPMVNRAAPVQICSVQTLARRGWRSWPECDLFITDEAHVQYKLQSELMEKWNNLKYLGLSATPFTTGLGRIWDSLVVSATTGQLIEQGYLSPYEAYGPCSPDLTHMQYQGGDYARRMLEERMNPLTGNILTHWQSMAGDRKTLGFASTVNHARELADTFNQAGISSDYVSHLDSESERKRKMDEYKSGDIRVMWNMEVLTRGFDQADVEVVILARPTRSLALHIQMLGRGLRHMEGKTCLFLDHAGNIERLGFPDDPLPTEMCMREKGVSEVDKRDKQEPQPWACPKCYHMVPPATPACPACGYRARTPSQVEVLPGVLQRLQKRGGPTDRQEVYSQLLMYAHNHGKPDYWAGWKFEKLFGNRPQGLKETLQDISPQIHNWIRSQNIAAAYRRGNDA